ncbi:hypothetical protein ACJX0J_011276, partial [Zea mays]
TLFDFNKQENVVRYMIALLQMEGMMEVIKNMILIWILLLPLIQLIAYAVGYEEERLLQSDFIVFVKKEFLDLLKKY